MYIDINRIKTEVSIVDLIGLQYELVRHGSQLRSKEHDSLIVYPFKNNWIWHSRLGDNGKKLGGSTIDWYMMAYGCDYKSAIYELDAMLNGGSVSRDPAAIPVKAEKKRHDNRTFSEKNLKRVTSAQKHLINGHPQGVDHLTNDRGLDIDTCINAGIGFDPKVFYSKDDNDQWLTAPGVLLPYYNLDGQLIGIRYRWLELVNGNRYFSKFGSEFGIVEFGLYHLIQRGQDINTLFVCEGEINALSIMQCGYDAVSVGSESTTISDRLVEFAKGYEHVICWMDKPGNAAVNAKMLDAIAVKSPVINDREQDANDLLKSGKLVDVLRSVAPDARRTEQPLVNEPESDFPDLTEPGIYTIHIDGKSYEIEKMRGGMIRLLHNDNYPEPVVRKQPEPIVPNHLDGPISEPLWLGPTPTMHEEEIYNYSIHYPTIVDALRQQKKFKEAYIKSAVWKPESNIYAVSTEHDHSQRMSVFAMSQDTVA